MNQPISFTVFGTPQPQGSTRAFMPRGWKRPIITTDNRRLKPWRQEIAETAIAQMNGQPPLEKTTAVSVAVTFYFAKPASTPKRVLDKTTKPDIDKLERALLDALTGICYVDDSQVAEVHKYKEFGTPERVEIRVGPKRPPTSETRHTSPLQVLSRQDTAAIGSLFEPETSNSKFETRNSAGARP